MFDKPTYVNLLGLFLTVNYNIALKIKENNI